MRWELSACVVLIAALFAAACTHAGAGGAVATAVAAEGKVQAANKLPTAFEAGWKGEKVCEPLFENDSVRAARCTFPPGIGHEKHFHPPHFGYIVQGATMRTTDKDGPLERVLQPGSTWWSDGIEWHEALNIGSSTGVYLIIEPK